MTESADLEEHLDEASAALTAATVAVPASVLSSDQVAALVGQVRAAERQCVALLVGLGTKASDLAAAGAGPPLEVVLRDGSSVSEATVYRDRNRARVAEAFPAVGLGVDSAVVFPENLDVLARITGRMTPDEVTALTEHDTDLAAAAGRLGVDSFRKIMARPPNNKPKPRNAPVSQFPGTRTATSC